VAKHKGQYRLDDEARDPEALEKALAHVEGQLAPALHRVRDAGKIEHKNQLPELLSLIALIHARSPRTRESLDLMIARRLKRDLLSGAMTPEQWSNIRQTELRAGVPERLMPDFNEAKRLAASNRTPGNIPAVGSLDRGNTLGTVVVAVASGSCEDRLHLLRLPTLLTKR
jgi:hypothetical protein